MSKEKINDFEFKYVIKEGSQDIARHYQKMAQHPALADISQYLGSDPGRSIMLKLHFNRKMRQEVYGPSKNFTGNYGLYFAPGTVSSRELLGLVNNFDKFYQPFTLVEQEEKPKIFTVLSYEAEQFARATLFPYKYGQLLQPVYFRIIGNTLPEKRVEMNVSLMIDDIPVVFTCSFEYEEVKDIFFLSDREDAAMVSPNFLINDNMFQTFQQGPSSFAKDEFLFWKPEFQDESEILPPSEIISQVMKPLLQRMMDENVEEDVQMNGSWNM